MDQKFWKRFEDMYISAHLRLSGVIFPATDVDVSDVDKPWELVVAGVREGDGGADLQPAVRRGGADEYQRENYQDLHYHDTSGHYLQIQVKL